MKKTVEKIKLFDLKATNLDTGQEELIKSDVYDILLRQDNMLKIKNTITGEEIVVTDDMVEEFIDNK